MTTCWDLDDFPIHECRVAIVDPINMRILAVSDELEIRLPRVSIPKGSRIAAAATEAIYEKFSINTIQLVSIADGESRGYFLVHELVTTSACATNSIGLVRIALEDLVPDQLSETEGILLKRIIAGDASEFGRFAAVRWIDDLLSTSGYGTDRSEWPEIRHLNQGINFSLLSVTQYDKTKRWFKAVGVPNTHEYFVTIELHQRIPAMVPKLLKAIPEWHAWWSEDVASGTRLDQSCDIEDWRRTLACLVGLQKQLASSSASFYDAGVETWTCSRLLSLLEPFFADATKASLAQTSERARRIEKVDLVGLRASIADGLSAVASSGLPDTLNHGDIGHGNILISARGPIFLDWAGCYVGPPFFVLEHLIADFDRCYPKRLQDVHLLRRTYWEGWQSHIAPESVRTMASVAPALAAFAYGVMVWQGSLHRGDPTEAWPVIRSMLRRTMREFDPVREVGVA
jgi:Phosphotransferase enzyme family